MMFIRVVRDVEVLRFAGVWVEYERINKFCSTWLGRAREEPNTRTDPPSPQTQTQTQTHTHKQTHIHI